MKHHVKTFLYAIIVLTIALSIYGCGSSSDSSPNCTSYADVSGTWYTTETVHDENCGGSTYNQYNTIHITQNGSSATLEFVGVGTFNGTVCNNTVSGSATFPEGNGTTTNNVSITLSDSDPDSASGSASWTYTETGWGSCTGTTTISAYRY